MAKRVVEHSEGAIRGHGLMPTQRQKIQEWEERVQSHETGAAVNDVAELEEILKRAIILRDVAGKGIHNTSKYQASKWKAIELIIHNGHAWSTYPKAERSTSMRATSGRPLGKLPRMNQKLFGFLVDRTKISQSTSSFSRTAMPTRCRRPTRGSKTFAMPWAIQSWPKSFWRELCGQHHGQKKETAGS